MALSPGSMVYATDADHIKSFVPVIETMSKNLVVGVDHFILADATAGNITFTLPAISPGNKNGAFFIKRIDTSTNWVKIVRSGADTIDLSTEMILGLPHEWLGVQSDGLATWLRFSQRTFSIAGMTYANPVPSVALNLTNVYQKFDQFDANVFSTPGRLVPDHTTDSIAVQSIYSPTFDGYEVVFDLCFQFNNNVDVFIELRVGGVSTGKGTCATGRGANNVFTGFNVVVPIAPAAPKNIEVWIRQENAGPNAITVSKANLSANKIGG